MCVCVCDVAGLCITVCEQVFNLICSSVTYTHTHSHSLLCAVMLVVVAG